MIRVRFVKVWRMYQPGEFAGFDESLAAQIVASGFAVTVEGGEISVPETKAQKAARLKAEAARQAQEEADRKAAEEAEAARQAQEEADRKAAEEAEAARQAQEEADRKAAEEADAARKAAKAK